MIVITDSNIIISAIISEKSVISNIILEENKIQFLAPSFIIEEIKKHQQKIILISKISSKQFKTRFELLLSKIKIIDVDAIPKIHKTKALEIVKDIDFDDFFFVALYLYKKHKIWTGDKVLIKGLKSKGLDICITTTELKNSIYKKKN